MDPKQSTVEALAVRDGRVLAAGTTKAVMAHRGPATRVIELRGKTVIPGLNDSHLHVIRGGLHYNLELRWDGVRSLGDALERLRIQAQNTPPPQWVRVVGGWNEFQFAEGRMPTLAEINTAAPDTPVFILHLYDRALLNRAALRVLGYDEHPPEFDRGVIERDAKGRATGMLFAKPSAAILYGTLGRAPVLAPEDQANSSRHFMRELNRLGVTSAIDAGGGGQNYPGDYAVIQGLARAQQMTVRVGYDLFAQKAGAELADYQRWTGMTRPGDGDDYLRMLGAGENLTWAAADFENFLEPRPELGASHGGAARADRAAARGEALAVPDPRHLRRIDRALPVGVRAREPDVPLRGLHWFIDHAETISDRNLERVRALEGGIAIQHRMAFQGEYFIARYGKDAAKRTPPIRRMLEMGLPVGAGTDATRVASYNPWVCLGWLVSGRTLGGTALYPETNRLERDEALRLWTRGSAWFSSEQEKKGALAPGQLADLAVLSKDFFSVPEAEIQTIESALTIVGGEVVHAAQEFAALAPPLPPVSPAWSPVARFGGAATPARAFGSARRGRPLPRFRRARLRLLRRLRRSNSKEDPHEHDHDERRNGDLLQGLGQGTARRLQSRLAALGGRLGSADVLPRRARLPVHRARPARARTFESAVARQRDGHLRRRSCGARRRARPRERDPRRALDRRRRGRALHRTSRYETRGQGSADGCGAAAHAEDGCESGGLPKEVFDGFRASYLADRSQFFLEVASGPFFGFNRSGAKVSQGMIQSWWMQGMHDGIQERVRLHRGVLRDRLHRGSEEVRRADADPARRRRPGRADRRVGDALGEARGADPR